MRSTKRVNQTLVLAIGTAVLGGCAVLAGAAETRKPASQPAVEAVDFNRDVRPILSAKCFACHGPDEGSRAAGLRLDLRDEAVKLRGAARAVWPGNPAKSRIYARITEKTPARKMPPPSSGHSLSAAETATLRRWIEQGAPYAEHWSFRRLRRPPVPAVSGSKWVRSPIDAFVLQRLQLAGLKPSPEADRYTLIRRVSLDLTGLPPTPEEVEAFVADRSPDAYEKLVDRLLASPHYGERWARMWLDLARYADSAGYGSDPLRPNIWPYRDWVIDAFNRNLPYDRFTIEQLAGDLLPNPSREQLVATAFHRNTMTNTEGGTDDEEFRVAAVKDRIATTSQVWMGLTMGCAQCHTHKFDPISHQDYYRFFALFNQTEDADRPDEAPTLPLPTPEQEAQRQKLEAEIASLKSQAQSEEQKKLLEQKQKELAAIQPVAVPVLRELPAEKHRATRLLIKGNFLDPGEEVKPAIPASFPPLPKGAPLNRLGVAQWLVAPENPLTARVAVNRFWAQLFGTGIVETEEDFGTQGALPSHRELLDWLASEFSGVGTPPVLDGETEGRRDGESRDRRAGSAPGQAGVRNPSHPQSLRLSVASGPADAASRKWNVKTLLKRIVTSATYRQSARVTPELLEKDPRNRLLSRYPRRRLDAEGVRDQALALSGLLSRKIGGPSVYPPQPEGLWRAAFNGERTWPTSTGEDRYRRGLYTFWRRTVPYPSMATFDAPSREICTVRRIPTNTPLQALVTLNDPAYVEMAQALGRRLVREGGATPAQRARYGLRLALARPVAEAQVTALVELYRQELEHYRTRPEEAKKLATDPLGPVPEGADPAELAAWTVVANVLLNLDGILTRN
ncbi:MAG: DUF1549 domain-containing protein [Armatimonadota bacterium]